MSVRFYTKVQIGGMASLQVIRLRFIDLGMQPEGGEADKLHFPQNMAASGSQSTGTAPDGAGHPFDSEGGVAGADNVPP